MLSILTLLLLSSFTLATPLDESTDAAKEAINSYSLPPHFPHVWCTHVRLKWYSYTWNLSLPENQINQINVFRRPTESSHQIHASPCVPLIQVQHLFNKILWCNTSAADNLSILSQRMLHPYLLDTVYLRLTWTLYFWSTLLPPQGLTSPKPERGCVKTDCFDEALCREYEQHHVMTSSAINHHHHLRLMMMMGFIVRWWKVMEGRKGIEQWWDALFSCLVFFADS